MWIGNLDGRREGLVIAPTKKRAIEVVGAGRTDFENHWVQKPSVDMTLSAETLYTRRFDDRESVWFAGRCPL